MTTVQWARPVGGADTPVAGETVQLDAVQQAVVDRDLGPLVVVGAPGSGKTTVAIASVVARVHQGLIRPDQVLVWSANRAAASQIRLQITRDLAQSGSAVRAVSEPVARTVHSYAFGLVRQARLAAGLAPPRLLSGSEQDHVVADILAGHVLGVGRTPHWPEQITTHVQALPGFRAQLRDLITRCAERGVGPERLAELGEQHRRPEWIAAAEVYREYLEITALASPEAYDVAGIITAATALLTSDDALLARERERRACVVADDALDLPRAALDLLQVLAGAGHDVVLTADPDTSSQSFRGSRPDLLRDLPGLVRTRTGGEAPLVLLPMVYRHGQMLRQVIAEFSGRIGSTGVVRHRQASAAGSATGAMAGVAAVQVRVADSPAHESSAVVGLLRTAHLHRDVSWRNMAVLVRTGAQIPVVQRWLAAAGIPAVTPGPVGVASARGSQIFVQAMHWVGRYVAGPEAASADSSDVEDAANALLHSVLGEVDSVLVRRLRQVLVAASPTSTVSFTPLADALSAAVADALAQRPMAPALAQVPVVVSAGWHRLVRVLTAGVQAQLDPEATPVTVLWALWQASGLANAWLQAALSYGPQAVQADHDADAVCALFELAQRFTERFPGAGALAFAAEVSSQVLPEDSLAPRAPTGDAVSVMTASAAAGRQWSVVAVAGVHDAVWPNTRIQGSLVGVQELVDALDHRLNLGSAPADIVAQQRRAVLDDELRLWVLALSRARDQVLVSAVDNEDFTPSLYLETLAEMLNAAADHAGTDALMVGQTTPSGAALVAGSLPVTLPALVARLRQLVCDPQQDEASRARSAKQLARLARAQVPGAHPDQWQQLTEVSDVGPLRAAATGNAPVRVSPSKVEAFMRCPLRWMLENSGGRRPVGTAVAMGTMVHRVAHEYPDGSAEVLRARLRELWPELGLRPGWVGEVTSARADRMIVKLAQYTAQAQRSGRELVGTEIPVRQRLGSALVVGSIDRLERDAGGSLVVVDLKTGASGVKREDLPRHAQLGTYQAVVAADQGESVSGAILVQLGTDSKSVVVQSQKAMVDDEDPQWVYQLLDKAAGGMSGATFPAQVNPSCRACGVRRSCPAFAQG